jgi:hypothetical protein
MCFPLPQSTHQTMQLPGADNAVVDLTKLRDYCLSPDHPRGRHKARVFAAALGWTQVDAQYVGDLLLDAAVNQEAIPDSADGFGDQYLIDLNVTDVSDQPRVVRSRWIVRRGENFPRFVTCYLQK